FIDAWTLDLEHRLAEQQFGRLPRKRRPDGRNMPAQAFGQFGRFPVVQRQGITLVLYNNAGAGTRAFYKAPAQLLRQWLGPEKDLVVAQAHLSAMAPDSRQAQGCKEAIQIANWTTAHQSKRPVREIEQPLERFEKSAGKLHFDRRRTNIHDGSVDVEQKSNSLQIKLGENVHDRGVGNRVHYDNSAGARRFARLLSGRAPQHLRRLRSRPGIRARRLSLPCERSHASHPRQDSPSVLRQLAPRL